MPPNITIAAKALRVCVLVAERLGVPREALLGPLGADPAVLDDADAQVPFAWIQHAWSEAPRLTGDPAFGLHAAELTTGIQAHVLDYVTVHCHRPREVFHAIERYQRLLMSRASLRLHVAGDLAVFAHPAEDIPGPRPAQMDDFVVAQWALRVRARRKGAFPLRRVTFMHDAPADTREHARVFAAPVEFGAEQDAIEFDAALLDVELEGADDTLVRYLRQHADALLARMPEASSAAETLRRHLVQAPPDDMASIDSAARALGMSERTLQRRLGEEGTSFKDELDATRRDLALSYLDDPRHSISDVAFLVGFAEVSAFSRAFRRWTRRSPTTWRRARPALAAPAKPMAPAGKTGSAGRP